MKKIIVTGGTSRFAQSLKKIKSTYKIKYPLKKNFNILKYNQIFKFLKKENPNYLIHLAGLSRPMMDHDILISKSIDLNIIGTANIVKACEKLNIKLIYFSTHHVYPGTKGNYKESSPVKPYLNYAWSKLGGECSVHMYKNSLILRLCMTEFPFIHSSAFYDVFNNFIFHKEVAKILFKILDEKGVINIGGPKSSIYKFAKKYNNHVIKISSKKHFKFSYPKKQDMDISKLKKILGR